MSTLVSLVKIGNDDSNSNNDYGGGGGGDGHFAWCISCDFPRILSVTCQNSWQQKMFRAKMAELNEGTQFVLANLIVFVVINGRYPNALGTAVAQWLRCCATNRKVAG